jgi:PilZ domain
MSHPEASKALAFGVNDPPTTERRVFIRYPRHLETLWQTLGLPGRDMMTATVFDIGVSGIGLHSNQALPVDKTVIVRLHSSTHGWSSHLVRIKYSREIQPGQFQVGCVFVRPLTSEQLRKLLA